MYRKIGPVKFTNKATFSGMWYAESFISLNLLHPVVTSHESKAFAMSASFCVYLTHKQSKDALANKQKTSIGFYVMS